MSRPPPNTSHHRSPSHDPQDLHHSPPPSSNNTSTTGHNRRASTHSIPVSYAYGAPSVGTGKPRTPARVARTGGSQIGSPSVGGSASARGGEEEEPEEEQEQEEEAEEWTGRSKEPAAVRYARMKQRQKDTGQPFLPPPPPPSGLLPPASLAKPRSVGSTPLTGFQNTSVNIATAFREAVVGGGVMRQPVGGPAPVERMQREEEEEGEEEEIGSGKETHVAGGAAGASASKKRKKRSNAPKDPSFKHRPGDTTDSESGSDFGGGEGGTRGKAKKARTVTEDGEAPPSASKKSTTTRRKLHIPSDSAPYHPNPTSSGSSSDSGSDLASSTHRRRKSKGKGRNSVGSSQAIPIGRRDGEVWFGGKKRKGTKKGKRGSGEGSVGIEGEEEGEGEGEDMGGMEEGDFNHPDNQQEEDDTTPAPTSYFLRLKSPSPNPSATTTTGANHLSPGAHSPFQPSRIFNSNPTPDPILAAFDHSLANGSTSNSNSNDFSSSFHLHANERSRRSPSFDASIISVRTDHDYAEEERIVRALEEQKRVGGLGGQAGGTGLRRRMPGPPGTASAASTLGGIREEPEGAGVGKRLGEGVRPLWKGVEKVVEWFKNPLIDWKRVWKAVWVVGIVLWLYFALSSPPTPPPPSRSSWNPFRSSPPTPFIPPDIPADSLPALISRLTLLETAMGELSTLSTSERTRSSSDRQLLSRLDEQVGALENGLEGERERSRKAVEEGTKEGRKEAKELEKTIRSVKLDLESLVTRVRTIQEERQADVEDLRKLQVGVQDVGKEIAQLGSKVAEVSKDVQAGVEGERIARIALEAIEQVLPSKLAVRMDGKGKLEIDPTFWRYLKEAFAGRNEVERIVKTEVGRLPAPVVAGGSSSPEEKEVYKVIVKEPPSWDDFLAANEVSLRTWVTSDLASRTGSDAIVSKRTFVEMLKKELKVLKNEFETKANENVEKIGQELLSKVAKQEEMKKKDSLASHLNPFHRSNNPPTITVKAPDGQNLTSIITTLVDSALLRYSKDVLARPDFALYTAGARVIRSLTSPTYSPTPLTRTRRALAWISGTHLPQGRAPITALHPDTSPGACWPFEGQQGQLGIQLSRRVVPSDVSIEHVSVDVAVDGEVRSAPKEWEMWGVVEGPEDVKRLEEYRKEARLAAGSDDDALEKALSTSIPPTPNHLLLAHGLYDTTLPSPVQTFPVTVEARQLAIPVQTVVLRVRSNHGERAFTCLYRVRVSGRTEEMVKKEMEGEA